MRTARTMRILPSIMAKRQQEMDSLLSKLKGISTEVHLDVADGTFVPNTSLWFDVRLPSTFRYTAHLMVTNPEQWIEQNGKLVGTYIVQVEVIKDIDDYIKKTKQQKKKVAFALNPETKWTILKPYLQEIDVVLILTVHPGFYGAKYLKSPLKKIQPLKKVNPKIKIIVDGGMNPATIKDARNAGADDVVSGSYLTNSADPQKAMKELKRAMKR
ncbi:hypothetical protein J4228_03115 [Candidatus Woesearchaeota archaeon]|nr:hypothetical protein [Candidatus Woesearchaeota archaeon]